MTDPWARPSGAGDGADRHVVEIELDQAPSPRPRRTGERAGGAPVPGGRRGRRARWAVPVVLLGGAGLAMTIVGGGAGDDAAAPASTTLDPARITTPPTLPDLVTVPDASPPTTAPTSDRVPGRGTNPGVDSPDLTFPDEAPFDPTTATLPAFDEVLVTDPDDLAAYDLDLAAAAAGNTTGTTPLRTRVSLEGIQLGGLYRSTAEAFVTSDPERSRDSIDLAWNVGAPARFVTDRVTDTVYRTDESLEGRWEELPGERFINGTGADTLGALIDEMLTGPITARTLAAADVEAADTLVVLDTGQVARPFTVTVPIQALRPYGILLFAQIADETVADGTAPDSITFTAYVSGARLALVTTRFETDDTVFVLQLSSEPAVDGDAIELPEREMIVSRSPQPGP